MHDRVDTTADASIVLPFRALSVTYMSHTCNHPSCKIFCAMSSSFRTSHGTSSQRERWLMVWVSRCGRKEPAARDVITSAHRCPPLEDASRYPTSRLPAPAPNQSSLCPTSSFQPCFVVVAPCDISQTFQALYGDALQLRTSPVVSTLDRTLSQ